MDFWASLEHSLRYKSAGAIPQDISDELVQIADDITCLDTRMQGIRDQVDLLYPSSSHPQESDDLAP